MAQYFQNFPYTTASYAGNDVIVRDIIRAIDMTVITEGNPGLFIEYIMQDGEKIENVAYNFYGSTQYHWVLIYINGIKDHINDLPQKDYILRQACIDIYGSTDGTHHFENANNPGEVVDFLFTPGYPVTNIDHMTAENEKKRKIKILREEYLTQFVSMYLSQLGD